MGAASLLVHEVDGARGVASGPWPTPSSAARRLPLCILVVDADPVLREALGERLAGFCRRVLTADLLDFAAVQEALLLRPELIVCGFERRPGLGLFVPDGSSVVQLRPTASGDLVGVLVRGAVPAPLSMDALHEVGCDALAQAPMLRARMAARARARLPTATSP